MLAKSCPKVSLQSCLSQESCDVKLGMDKCAWNNYGVTLKRKNTWIERTSKF